jgi:hypothetical protein
MRKSDFKIIALAFFVHLCPSGAALQATAQAEKTAYPAMAPMEAYLIADQNSEIALARSGAPPSIADGAEVMVLGTRGYTTAVKGTDGFLCLVERSWGASTDDPEFWNPKVRSPTCFNPAAARTFAPIFLIKTKLALKGKSKTEILAATASALDKKELPALEPGAMCYMMSKQQYLDDDAKAWHPHLMLFVAGNAADAWGANRDGVPVLATNDPDDRLTIMLLTVDRWSDGTPANKKN